MRWSKGWIASAGVFSVIVAVGGTAFALAGAESPAAQSDVAGKEVCSGQPVTLVGNTGSAGVFSDQLPVGTSLRITNTANGRAATVPVAGVSTGCAAVNTAAFDLLWSAGSSRGEEESALRRIRVEIVGNAPAPVQTAAPRVRATGVVGQVVCDGATVGLSAVSGAPGAFSSTLPVGTSVRVTNLDNGRQATVRIVGVGPACVVLNSAAFQLVGESGKSLIERAQLEKVV